MTAPTSDPAAPGASHSNRRQPFKLSDMRAYSHALFSLYAARRLAPAQPGVAAWTALGAALPDLPTLAGAVWLGVRRRRWFSRQEFCEEACEKGPFGGPDAALHSALPVTLLLALRKASGARDPLSTALLLGWAGHVLADALTHAEDARPILWPLSGRRFASPISYWDRAHHALPLTLVEHAALLLLAAGMLRSRKTETPTKG